MLVFALNWLCYLVSLYRGAHALSLYRQRRLWCGYNPRRMKRRCSELNTEVTFHRNPASLAYSTRTRCSGRCTSPCSSPWARPGPMTRSHIAGEPCGSRIDKLPSISWLNSKTSLFLWLAWWIKLVPGSFNVKPWSGLVLKKSFEWHALFWRKRALTECSPRASSYLKQKVKGSWIFIVGKTKNLFWGYIPCSPWASF
jgi:hypothetical protein